MLAWRVDSAIAWALAIDDLLEIGDKAALAPSRRMIDQVAVAGDRAPQRHLRFPHRLRVDGVRGAAGACPVRKTVAARQLAAGDVGKGVFGRAVGRRAGIHVDFRGEAAIVPRRPGADGLVQAWSVHDGAFDFFLRCVPRLSGATLDGRVWTLK